MPREFESTADLQRTYNDTYVVYEGQLYYLVVERVFVHFYKVNADGSLVEEPAIKADFNTKKWKDVKLLCPEIGWIKGDRGIWFTFLKAIRQYKFGLHRGILHRAMFSDNGKELKDVGPCNTTQTFLAAIQKPPAKFDLKNLGKLQVLSKRFVVNTQGQLWMKADAIGEWDQTAFRLYPYCDDSLTVVDLKELGVPLHGW